MVIAKTSDNIYGLQVYHKAGLTGTALLADANARGIWGWHIKNTLAAASYVQIFDAATAGAVTLGTTVPVLSIGIEASAHSELALARPIMLTSGMVVASTTTDEGNTGAAQDVDIYYA